PERERPLRALSVLVEEPEALVAAWRLAQEREGPQPSGAAVRAAVVAVQQERDGKRQPLPPHEPEAPNEREPVPDQPGTLRYEYQNEERRRLFEGLPKALQKALRQIGRDQVDTLHL